MEEKQTLCGRKNKRILLVGGFALPALLMLLVFACCGIAPFGELSLGVMDMSHQYLGFFGCFRRVLSGELSPFYLPAMCLGVNLPAAMGYYIFSPLNVLFCLVDEAHMLLMAGIIYILRIGLCGLSMTWYTGRKYGWTPKCLLAAVGYAFMGYMIANCINFLWHDCVILLPVLAAGIERLVKERRPWLYVAVLALCIIFCYYIGYMLCIFSVLWFAAEFLCRAKDGKGGRVILSFALSSLAAGAISMVVMLPQMLAVSGGPQEFSLSILSWEPKFSLGELASKVFTGAFHYNEITPSGLPNIFFGMGVLALAVLYFFNRRIPARRRVVSGALVLVMVLSMWIHGLDVIWHCLNEPVWYNGRYTFIFNFIMLALAMRELFELRDGHRWWHFAVPTVVALGLAAAAFVGGRDYLYLTVGRALVCCAEVAVLSAALGLSNRWTEKPKAALAMLALFLLLSCADLTVNAVTDLRALTKTAAAKEPAYEQYSYAMQEVLALRPESDTVERTESVVCFNQEHCEPMLYGYNGISGYSSTIPTGNLQLLQNMGFTRYEDRWAIYGDGITTAADSFLGVRYIIGTGEENRGYEALASTESYTLYENKNALSAAFFASSIEDIAAENCFEYINALYSNTLGREIGIFASARVLSVTEADAVSGEEDGFIVYSAAPGAQGLPSVTWEIVTAADGPLYAAWGTETNQYYSTFIYVNDELVEMNYLSTVSNGSVCLGTFAQGETVRVTMQFGDTVKLSYAAFYTEREETLSAACEEIAAVGCALTERSSARYTGTFTAEQDGYLLITMADDGGWRVWLDGEEAESVTAYGCLVAVAVTAGEHTLQMRYTPPGQVGGLVITVVALSACVAVGLWRKKKPDEMP